MIFGLRIGKRTERERRLTKVAEGIFVAKDANRIDESRDFFEDSPIVDASEAAEGDARKSK